MDTIQYNFVLIFFYLLSSAAWIMYVYDANDHSGNVMLNKN